MTVQVSSKQYDSIVQSDARYNMWVGAVRSGKTFASLARFDDFVKHGPPGDYAIIGKSRDTIKRNVLGPLKDMLGWRLSWSLGRAEANLYNRTIHIIGANDERAEHRIRGLTLAGAYVDEMTIIPETVFKMLGSRLSVTGAKCFGTTNPDSPFHWLKKDFIDRADELDLKVFDFVLSDNPSLDPRFVESLKREYRGLWYQRYIEGKWVLAEGTIFDFFDESLHVIDYPPGAADYYVVGVDYGTTNPTAFSMIGYSERTQPNKWLEREWYYDSKVHQRQMTDSEYAVALKKFIDGYKVTAIYVDPSAASFKLELQRAGFSGVIEAENEVLDGIRYHSMQLSNGSYKVLRCCKQAIEEYCTYRWDSNAAARGEDKPLKSNDHCFAAGTLVATGGGDKPIESIDVGDYVYTRGGLRQVLATWESIDEKDLVDVDGIICTPDHPFVTANRGKVPAVDLTLSDTLYILSVRGCVSWNERQQSGMASDISAILEDPINQSGITLGATGITYIERCGNSTWEKSPMECMSTTKTETRRTIVSTTWKSYRLKITLPDTPQVGDWREHVDMLPILDHLQRNGTPQQLEESGTEETERDVGLLLSYGLSTAKCAAPTTPSEPCTEATGFVPTRASQHIEGGAASTTSKESVVIAPNPSQQTSIITQSHVLGRVPRRLDGRRERVYNLTVEGEHEYFVNGVLVSNCLDSIRYALFSEWYKREGPRLKAEDIERQREEALGAHHAPKLGKFFDDKPW